MKPMLVWIGWIATLPGLALAAGVVATLAGVPEAVGCVPERMLALRCPETLLGSAVRDLHDLGVITMLAPHLFIWPVLYTIGFPLARLAARATADRPGREGHGQAVVGERMRIRWDIIGALLAIPGFIVIASVLALGPLVSWAGCSQSGLETRCPATPAGSIAEFAGTVVALTYIFSYVGIGILPPAYTFVWAVRLVARRFGWWVPIGVVVALGVLAGIVGAGSNADRANGLIGLAAFAVIGWLVWRAIRKRRAPPPA